MLAGDVRRGLNGCEGGCSWQASRCWLLLLCGVMDTPPAIQSSKGSCAIRASIWTQIQ
jgi:hypothetical protein